MKKILLLILIQIISNSVISQGYVYSENSKKQNGKVSYLYHFNRSEKSLSGKELNHINNIYNSQIYDWKNSISKFDDDVLSKENNNSINLESQFIVEHCTLKNGVKNGAFVLALCTMAISKGKIFINEIRNLEEGEYLNGEYNGVILSLNQKEIWSRKTSVKDILENWNEFDTKKIIYQNGKIKDQKIYFGDKYYVFQNNKVTEAFRLNEFSLPLLQFFNDEYSINYSLTQKPFCWNMFSFFTEEDRSKNAKKPFVSFFNKALNNDMYILEIYKFNNKTKSISDYTLYRGKDLYSENKITNLEIQDTANLEILGVYSFSNGLKKNGEAKIFNNSNNGNGLIYSLNYKDDLLEGECKKFFKNGKIAYKINFNRGLPVGEVISYFDPNEKTSIFQTLVRSDHMKAGVFLPQSVMGMWDDKEIQNLLDIITENGGEVEDINTHQVISKTFYVLDSVEQSNGIWERFSYAKNDLTIFNNGKPMVFYTIDNNSSEKNNFLAKYKANVVDYVYMDKTGKVVFNKEQEDEKSAEKRKKKEEKQEEILNSIQRCKWCNKEVVYKNGVITDDEIKCYNRTIIGCTRYIVCSNACKASYEDNKCQKN